MHILRNQSDKNRFNIAEIPDQVEDPKKSGINGYKGGIIGWISEKIFKKTVHVKGDDKKVYYFNCKSLENWRKRVAGDDFKETDMHDPEAVKKMISDIAANRDTSQVNERSRKEESRSSFGDEDRGVEGPLPNTKSVVKPSKITKKNIANVDQPPQVKREDITNVVQSPQVVKKDKEIEERLKAIGILKSAGFNSNSDYRPDGHVPSLVDLINNKVLLTEREKIEKASEIAFTLSNNLSTYIQGVNNLKPLNELLNHYKDSGQEGNFNRLFNSLKYVSDQGWLYEDKEKGRKNELLEIVQRFDKSTKIEEPPVRIEKKEVLFHSPSSPDVVSEKPPVKVNDPVGILNQAKIRKNFLDEPAFEMLIKNIVNSIDDRRVHYNVPIYVNLYVTSVEDIQPLLDLADHYKKNNEIDKSNVIVKTLEDLFKFGGFDENTTRKLKDFIQANTGKVPEMKEQPKTVEKEKPVTGIFTTDTSNIQKEVPVIKVLIEATGKKFKESSFFFKQPDDFPKHAFLISKYINAKNQQFLNHNILHLIRNLDDAGPVIVLLNKYPVNSENYMLIKQALEYSYNNQDSPLTVEQKKQLDSVLFEK